MVVGAEEGVMIGMHVSVGMAVGMREGASLGMLEADGAPDVVDGRSIGTECTPCHVARCPGPLEVEAADPTIDIQHFSDQVKPRTES